MAKLSIHNPFTPTEIAKGQDDFFGRKNELDLLEASVNVGSLAIQGAMGIGKSSLLANFLEKIDGQNMQSVVAVANPDLTSIDDVARLILENLITVDEAHEKLILKVPSLAEYESTEVTKYYQAGRHLAVLQRIIQKDFSEWLLGGKEWLVLGIDEADKSPTHIARFFRSIATHVQQNGIKCVRFIFCGVRPFYQQMCETDGGVARFISRNLNLSLLPSDESEELLTAKFKAVADAAHEDGFPLEIEPELITDIRKVSGGHPHLLQLLGSHIVEQENENPDGKLDIYDLVRALSRICYEDRIESHAATLHSIELYGYEDEFYSLLDRMRRFPSRINRALARQIVSKEALEWFLQNNVLILDDEDSYALVDEFLRIRIIMESENRENLIISQLEHRERVTGYHTQPDDHFDPREGDEY